MANVTITVKHWPMLWNYSKFIYQNKIMSVFLPRRKSMNNFMCL